MPCNRSWLTADYASRSASLPPENDFPIALIHFPGKIGQISAAIGHQSKFSSFPRCKSSILRLIFRRGARNAKRFIGLVEQSGGGGGKITN